MSLNGAIVSILFPYCLHKAVIENDKGLHLQVDFGHEQTALIKASQVLE